jgi:hypothetical protein
VLSLACAVLYETLAALLSLRARLLREGLFSIFDSKDFAYAFFDNPIIKSLSVGRRTPAYIPPRSFALALLSILGAEALARGTASSSASEPPTSANDAAGQLPPNLFFTLRVMLEEAEGDAGRLRAGVERWFEGVMDQLSGAYRKRALVSLLCMSFVFAAAVNADSINIVRTLSRSAFQERRVATAATAEYVLSPAPTPPNNPRDPSQTLQPNWIGIPVGWADGTTAETPRGVPNDPGDWIQKILGFLITALLVTLGASLWFDLLNKIAFLRADAKPHESSCPTPLKDAPGTESGEWT